MWDIIVLSVNVFNLIAIVIFGSASLYMLFLIFDRKPGLVINDEGIIDRSSAIGAGPVRWGNITNVDIYKVNVKTISGILSQKFLTIEVNNPDEILSRYSGSKKLLMNINNRYHKSPVHISDNLETSLEEMNIMVNERLSAYRSALNQ